MGAVFLTLDQLPQALPNWEESLSTWGLFYLLLLFFALALLLLWRYHQQKTPHSKE
jgi:hypothetical protein